MRNGSITKPDSVPDAVHPNWSPHGHRIAYWAVRGGQRDIWTVSADGTHPVAVTEDAALDWSPVWSPDGNYLYFASDRGGSMNLWRVRIDEKSGKVFGRPEPVTTPSPYSGPISISRDGKRIAYVHQTTTANIRKAAFDPIKETRRIAAAVDHPGLAAGRESSNFRRTANGWRSGTRASRKTSSSLGRMEPDSGSSPTMFTRTASPAGRPTAGASPFIPTAAANMTSG